MNILTNLINKIKGIFHKPPVVSEAVLKKKVRSAIWAKEHPDKIIEANNRWIAKNLDKVKEGKRKWREANPDKVKEIGDKYRETHREQIRARSKELHRINNEHINKLVRARYHKNKLNKDGG